MVPVQPFCCPVYLALSVSRGKHLVQGFGFLPQSWPRPRSCQDGPPPPALASHPHASCDDTQPFSFRGHVRSHAALELKL